MPSIKDNIFGGFGGSGSSSGNPTAPEVFLYDTIDDIRSWINKNKRSNTTGKQIKPVLNKWLGSLAKVYPLFEKDRNLPNSAILTGMIIDINDYLKKLVNKPDSELTFEYLVKQGSPERSRAAFWAVIDKKFAAMAANLKVQKQGSLYRRPGSSGVGVLGNGQLADEPQDNKDRWFSNSRILGRAGSHRLGSHEQELQAGTLKNPSGTAKPLGGSTPASSTPSSSPSSSVPSSSTNKPNEPYDGSIISKEDFARYRGGDDSFRPAFQEIAQNVSKYIIDAIAQVSPSVGMLDELISDVELAINSADVITDYVEKLHDPITTVDSFQLSKTIGDIEKDFFNNGKGVNVKGEISKLSKYLTFIPEGQNIPLFGANVNSDDGVDKLRVSVRNGNNNNNNNNNNNSRDLTEKDDSGNNIFKNASQLFLAVRKIILENRRMYADIQAGDKYARMIDMNKAKLVDKLNDVVKSDNVKILSLYLKSDKYNFFNKMMGEISAILQNTDNMGDFLDENFNRESYKKSFQEVSDLLDKVYVILPKKANVNNQLKSLIDYNSSGSLGNFIELGQKAANVYGEVSAPNMLKYLALNVLANNAGGCKDVLTAYSDDGNNMNSVKSILLVREIAKREMVKMYQELESYWG